MAILLFIVFGFVIGLAARALMPGNQNMGAAMTTALGIAGSFIGGYLGSLITRHGVTEFHTAGVIGSLVGALIVLVIAEAISGRRHHV